MIPWKMCRQGDCLGNLFMATFPLVGKHFQLWIHHAFLIDSQFSSAFYSSLEYTAEYIFFESHVLTKVTVITQWNCFQTTDKTTNSPKEEAVVSQGKLKSPPDFCYLYLTYFIWGFHAIKHRGNSTANISDPWASIRNGLLQKKCI